MTGAIVTPRCPAHLSLDAELEGGSTMHELVGTDDPSPEEAFAQKEVRAQVEQALRILTPAERAVIDDRYVNDMTMAEVGEARGRTRQRIQQIESKSLARVRKALHVGR
jgi:RNA polymerase sigma factor (sigma-70 family)